MTIDIDAAKTRLVDRMQEIKRLSEISEDSRSTVDLDQQSVGRLSRMDSLQMQAMAQASERSRNLELQRIDAALARIATGDYGYCQECGEEIAHKRLEIDPSASLCIHCAGAKEN
ncbi:TraR/DksA family transcriptional regulator [Stappia sp. GBMRC 2046]|uniref:TraR/DksA family transcriptional regulator n=1 Tax=Stappia sediminis TaxID=2692190 RepID=A0A7X3S743_9HYPH|nr:TraR/DksA C4-type zinc finger protein [Stappia sediminis]MXN64438.1 TraR/DksA family transcriptional regulator [Stappia sediminis]